MPAFSYANELTSPSLRRIVRFLSLLEELPNGDATYRHVSQLLIDYEQSRRETEHLLAYLSVLLLDSIQSHLPLSSELNIESSCLKQRLIPPYGKSELETLRRLVEQFSDNLSIQESVREDDVHAALAPFYTFAKLYSRSADVLSMRKQNREYLENVEKEIAAGTDGHDREKKYFEGDIMGSMSERGRFDTMAGDDATGFTQDPILLGIKKTREFNERILTELSELKRADSGEILDVRKKALIGDLEGLLKDNSELVDYFTRLTQYLNAVKSNSHRLSKELNRMTTLSMTDELTRLPNRRAFVQRLDDEFGRTKRYGQSLSLALIDLDGFKPINDNYGHDAGDAALLAYAQDVLSGFRQNDFVARYGGEEFAVIFPNTNQEGALMALKKVLNRAQQMEFEYNQQSLRLPTFSAGLVVYEVGETLDNLIRRADRALYRAKRSGRNRIELESKPVESTPIE